MTKNKKIIQNIMNDESIEKCKILTNIGTRIKKYAYPRIVSEVVDKND